METSNKKSNKKNAGKVKKFNFVKWDNFENDMDRLREKYDETDNSRAIRRAVREALISKEFVVGA